MKILNSALFSSVALFLALAPLSGSAEAAYTRLWRGFQRADLSTSDFISGLNQGLLPATGRLKQTPVGILNYFPVALPQELVKQGLPAEVALLEYETEAQYQSYRATPEGQAYGDLHWEYFERTTSKSQVPGGYAGRVAFNQAYDVTRNDRLPGAGGAWFRAYTRNAGQTDEHFLASVEAHIGHVMDHSPATLVVSVNADSVLEYVIWASPADRAAAEVTAKDRHGRAGGVVILDPLREITGQLAFEAPLRKGRMISEGTGVRYRF